MPNFPQNAAYGDFYSYLQNLPIDPTKEKDFLVFTLKVRYKIYQKVKKKNIYFALNETPTLIGQ